MVFQNTQQYATGRHTLIITQSQFPSTPSIRSHNSTTQLRLALLSVLRF